MTLNGSGSQTIVSSTTFYALRAVTPGATIQFTAGTTQYVTNMVEFQNVNLKSAGANGTTWYFSYTGSSQTLVGLRGVRDSNASVNGGATTSVASGVAMPTVTGVQAAVAPAPSTTKTPLSPLRVRSAAVASEMTIWPP